ncbi:MULTISPECIES: hypothetical protein [unclassified Bradyrhizobium]|uniref:hypothetical protein n=1 Tax=unclassified Bradyrhizobium TaxID=2631580 RepID=UPI00291607B7|nr:MULTISPECIES: hypothetical protein [unclassified Bradyrhizobium]
MIRAQLTLGIIPFRMITPSVPLAALSSAQNEAGVPPTDPVAIPKESLAAEAAQGTVSTSPGSMVALTGSVVALSSGGLTINLIFDTAAMAAPASFRSGIQRAAVLLSSAISDKITINLKIDDQETGGGAAAGPDNGQWVSYSNVRSYLINNASPGDTTLALCQRFLWFKVILLSRFGILSSSCGDCWAPMTRRRMMEARLSQQILPRVCLVVSRFTS